MAHPRKLIRDSVAAILVAANTAAAGRVFKTRALPEKRTELPALAVYCDDETVDPDSELSAPRYLGRELTLSVEGMVRQGANVDDAMDALALEVEQALHLDSTLGGTAIDSIMRGTALEVVEEGDKLHGLVRLEYLVRYQTTAPAEGTQTLDDLETVGVTYAVDPSGDPRDQVQDELDGLDQ